MESQAMAFTKCPIEINQMIALNLSDKDICNFRLICVNTNDAIDADHGRFWFLRFRNTYDPPRRRPHADHGETKMVYQSRSKVMNTGVVFNRGITTSEKQALQVITELIVDARPTTDASFQRGGHNIDALKQIVRQTNILDCIFKRAGSSTTRTRAASNDVLPLIQLVLAPEALKFNQAAQVLSFDESQRAAYLSMADAPLFTGFNGTDVNVEWALHIVNFFRHHFLRQEEHTLYNAYKAMSKKSRGLALPQFPRDPISDEYRDAPMGKEWKGTYAYLERQEVINLRRGRQTNSNAHYLDKNVDSGYNGIQRMQIEFPKEASFPWPQLFEEHLDSIGFHHKILNPRPTRTRAQHSAYGPAPYIPEDKTRRFEGTGYDDEDFFSCGWLNPLPPQHGIMGWKRMTMMKFFQDNNGLVDVDALWAYEGVVLPGGEIIVGRWWSPEDSSDIGKTTMYSGPFILWNVDTYEQIRQAMQ